MGRLSLLSSPSSPVVRVDVAPRKSLRDLLSLFARGKMAGGARKKAGSGKSQLSSVGMFFKVIRKLTYSVILAYLCRVWRLWWEPLGAVTKELGGACGTSPQISLLFSWSGKRQTLQHLLTWRTCVSNHSVSYRFEALHLQLCSQYLTWPHQRCCLLLYHRVFLEQIMVTDTGINNVAQTSLLSTCGATKWELCY